MTVMTTDRLYRPLVYICSPLSGDVEANSERTRKFCRYAVEQGQIPLAPQFIDDDVKEERELAIFMDVILLGNRVSPGMQVELDVAKKRRQKVRWFNHEFQEVQTWD